jgi:hypothetical protein
LTRKQNFASGLSRKFLQQEIVQCLVIFEHSQRIANTAANKLRGELAVAHREAGAARVSSVLKYRDYLQEPSADIKPGLVERGT